MYKTRFDSQRMILNVFLNHFSKYFNGSRAPLPPFMANAILNFHFCFGTTIQFYLPVHFSTASKSSKSGQQQHPQRRLPGRTTGNDRKCLAVCRICSRPRVWSFGLHILLLFGSRLFSQISFALSFILSFDCTEALAQLRHCVLSKDYGPT